ncbi:MAG TPA: RNA-binding protein [Ignavibacteriales bacterium]|nr:RNA-binding protein [Ignavibacteriales bacterium]
MNIYVGNLANEVNEQDLEAAFGAFGEIKSAKVIRDNMTRESKGFAFVEMYGVQAGQNAIKELNSKEIKGKAIVVNEARPKTDSPRGGGSFGGGRNSGGRSNGGSSFGRNGGGRNRY